QTLDEDWFCVPAARVAEYAAHALLPSGLPDHTGPSGNSPRDIARIDHEPRVPQNPVVAESGMVCDDDQAILGGQELLCQRLAFKSHLRMAWGQQRRHVRVVIGDKGPALSQERQNPKGRRFAEIADVFLVGDTQNTDAAA